MLLFLNKQLVCGVFCICLALKQENIIFTQWEHSCLKLSTCSAFACMHVKLRSKGPTGEYFHFFIFSFFQCSKMQKQSVFTVSSHFALPNIVLFYRWHEPSWVHFKMRNTFTICTPACWNVVFCRTTKQKNCAFGPHVEVSSGMMLRCVRLCVWGRVCIIENVKKTKAMSGCVWDMLNLQINPVIAF